jgi:O-antigen biosynthesis protein
MIDSRQADILVIAFGAPRPLHTHWVRYCRGIVANFHLITDHPEDWRNLAEGAENFTLIESSLGDYFQRVAAALDLAGFAEFDAAHGRRLGHLYNGWTACHFKPLLGVMLADRLSQHLFGWMDWDVFPTNALLRRITEWEPDAPDVSLFTPRGIRWEQFKLFPRAAAGKIADEFREQLAIGRYAEEGGTCDAQFVYDPRRAPDERFFPIRQDEIAVHWRYLDVIGPEARPNLIGVRVNLRNATVRSLEDGRELAMFIGDDEMKGFSADEIQGCLSDDGEALDFPCPTAAGSRSEHPRAPKRHCIVTPDFIGPVKNGGIGTATFHQARFLHHELGHEVTVVFTGPVQNGTPAQWKAHYAQEHGITFRTLEDLPRNPAIPHHCTPWFLERSYRVHRWLREQEFDTVHFQDWQANGIVPVQAKQQGLDYGRTRLTCTLHSPQEWVDEGSRKFPAGGLDDILQRYAEKYAASRADLTLSPSLHMLEWVHQRGWKPRRSEVVPYLWTATPARSAAPGPRPVTELCFFGRWETRKGLEVFTSAIERLAQRLGTAGLPRISFLGKPGLAAGGCGRAHIERTGRRLGLPFVLLDDLDSAAAQEYLATRPGCVAVMPSLWDNLPYTVIECLQNGVDLLASDAGGVPELIASPEHLFHPCERALEAALERVISQGITPVRSAYDAAAAAALWTRLAEEGPPDRPQRGVTPGDITVCIAHHNHGSYLPGLLDSLAGQTVAGFHVIVVDDGSTDEASVATFLELEKTNASRWTWRFLRKVNGGIGETRNFAVAQSNSRYLVFLDADNLASPRMVETMMEAMRVSDADCLTCYFEGFTENPGGVHRAVYRYFPIGGCLAAGAFANIFGDANCIIDRTAFLAVGGFSTERGLSYEDWDLLARLALQGHKVDTIPEIIHYYRHTAGGFSRNTSRFLNLRRIVRAYSSHLSPWVAALMEGIYATVVPDANLDKFPDPDRDLQLARSDALIEQQRRRISEIEQSSSMRVTAPLRLLSYGLRRLVSVPASEAKEPPAPGAADPLAERQEMIERQSRKLRALESSLSWRISLPIRMGGRFCRAAERWGNDHSR